MNKYLIVESAEQVGTCYAGSIHDAAAVAGLTRPTISGDGLAFEWRTDGERSYAIEIILAD